VYIIQARDTLLEEQDSRRLRISATTLDRDA
jgi:hypothetical protein